MVRHEVPENIANLGDRNPLTAAAAYFVRAFDLQCHGSILPDGGGRAQWHKRGADGWAPAPMAYALAAATRGTMKTSAVSLKRAQSFRTCSKVRFRCPERNMLTADSEPN